MKKYEGHLISHTHWDREWYRTFESYRFSLVETFDKLLEIFDNDPNYKFFHADGQTIILEDYLAIRPEQEEKLKQYAREGRLLVGPWYVMPDEFLVSGESLVRNLQLGFRLAEDYGGAMPTGYVCDCFGHISQLPQLFRGFGIDNAFGARGVGDHPAQKQLEFEWEAPDGSRVLFIHQLYNYSNASCLGFDYIHSMELDCTVGGRFTFDMQRALKRLEKERDKLLPFASTKALRFDNGCDHMPPQPEVPAIIEAVNASELDFELVHSTWPAYARRVRELSRSFPVFAGEMRGTKYTGILNSVFSSHMEVKQANERTQVALEKLTEPLCAFAWMVGKPWPGGFLDHAWRLLLQNHPHDSICGCSIDEVHRQMMPRFARAQEVALELRKSARRYLASAFDTARAPAGLEVEKWLPVVVFNTLAKARSEAITLDLEWELAPDEAPPAAFSLVDETGRVMPARITAAEPRDRFTTGPGNEPPVPLYRFQPLHLEAFAEDVPAFGWRTYYLVPKALEAPQGAVHAGDDWLENAWYRLTVLPNGALEIVDKFTGATYGPLAFFEDSADAGDGYYYRSVEGDTPLVFDSETPQVSLVEATPWSARLKIGYSLQMPRALNAERKARSTETITLPVEVEVSLLSEQRRIELAVSLDNCAKDHRLRLLFDTGIASEVVHVDQAFDVVERSVHLPEAKDWKEPPVPWQPMQNFVDVSGEGRGLAVATKGIREYEAIPLENGELRLALTLFRAVYGFGGPEVSPEAQFQGKQRFELALLPHKGDWLEGAVYARTQDFRVPLEACSVAPSPGPRPPSGTFLQVAPESLAVSALLVDPDDQALVIRCYNLETRPVEGSFTFHERPERVVLCDLRGRELGAVALEAPEVSEHVRFVVPARKLITLKAEF